MCGKIGFVRFLCFPMKPQVLRDGVGCSPCGHRFDVPALPSGINLSLCRLSPHVACTSPSAICPELLFAPAHQPASQSIGLRIVSARRNGAERVDLSPLSAACLTNRFPTSSLASSCRPLKIHPSPRGFLFQVPILIAPLHRWRTVEHLRANSVNPDDLPGKW